MTSGSNPEPCGSSSRRDDRTLPADPPLIEDLPELANRRLLRRIGDEIVLLGSIGDDVEKRIRLQIPARLLLPVRDNELVSVVISVGGDAVAKSLAESNTRAIKTLLMPIGYQARAIRESEFRAASRHK